MRLTDLLEKVEHAENDQEDILYGDSQGIDGRILGSQEFEDGVNRKNGGCDQYDLSQCSLREIEVNEGGKTKILQKGEQAEEHIEQEIIGPAII